ncbi:MAG TPA: hypothetical protein H9931_03325 [Candidatus Enterocloster excrementigallinarum]|uniref:Uncharacterized protein n=1 Tax=Candidatus Enterocloster excrementigallinarum TaxID=2838558 RepID=A0A9D2TCV2_9FIRM|nr:hypothetical protein [Candidatus Enterocloster excrementigallinarum]
MGKIFVDGMEIAFSKLMDYASDRILEGFDNWLYNRRRRKEKERRAKKLTTEKLETPMTKIERILQEEGGSEPTAVDTSATTYPVNRGKTGQTNAN